MKEGLKAQGTGHRETGLKPVSTEDRQDNSLLVIEKFEGICPQCGQPFLAEYVTSLEQNIVMAMETIKTLRTINQLQEKKIKELESKKLVLVKRKVEVALN